MDPLNSKRMETFDINQRKKVRDYDNINATPMFDKITPKKASFG
jgi:hypothetical protein